MIEVPSAALIVERIAAECDFLSIGTNDLVQYTLAVDRNNPNVGHLYHHTHPAVLQLIARTIKAANDRGIPVSVCGEMAGEPRLALLLVGLGLRIFSTTPTAIPGLKTALSKLTLAKCQETAEACMAMGTTGEIDRLITRVLSEALGGQKLGGRSMR
jgi:phosphotransferase system enzyme I (PtsI)